MLGQFNDSLPRVARSLGLVAGNSPQVVTAWQRTSPSTTGDVVATLTPLASVPMSPTVLGGTTLPQESLTTPNGTFVAQNPLSPDPDIDEANNTVVVWVAKPPYDPNTMPAPTSNEIYLSYNAGPPFRVSTDQATPYGSFQVSSKYASIARVTMSRDGRRIAVGWSTGGDNLSVNAVNADSVFARTYTVNFPGDRTSIVADGLPVLITPAFTTSGSGGYPGYPGGGGTSSPRLVTSTGPYHFGDIASDKSDSSNAGYIAFSYVRQASWNGQYVGVSQTLPDGIFVKGYNWGLLSTFPSGGGEQALSPGTGRAFYSFSELDASHEASMGAGWFVLGFNVSSTLYAARFDAAGNGPESATPTMAQLSSSSMGWGFSVAARTNLGGVGFLVTQETSYPDVYGISIVHQVFGATGSTSGTAYDVVSPSYAVGSKRFTNPNAVLYDDGATVAIAYDGGGAVSQYRH